MTAVVPVFHPRAEPRRAVKRGYPRASGSVRHSLTLAAPRGYPRFTARRGSARG